MTKYYKLFLFNFNFYCFAPGVIGVLFASFFIRTNTNIIFFLLFAVVKVVEVFDEPEIFLLKSSF